MSRSILAVLVALLALLSIYLLWPAEPMEPFEIDPEQVSVAEAPEQAETPTQDPVPAPQPADDEGLQRTESETVAEAPADDIQPAASGPDSIPVRTIDEASGNPLPKTDVFALYPSDYDEAELEAKFQSGNTSLEEICMEYGVHYRSDDDGKTAVRRPMDRGAVLFARNGGQTTLAFNLDPNAEEWVVALQPDFAAEVKVVHNDGSPAIDVPVALRSRSEFYEFNLMMVRTDADGIASFKNLNVFLQDGIGPGGDMYLGLAMLLPPELASKEEHEVPLSVEDPPTEQLELRLPDYGSLRLRLLDDEGELVAMECWAAIERVSEDADGGRASNPLKVPMRNGEVVFPYLALNQQVQVMAGHQAGQLGEMQTVNGPVRAGEEVVVDIVLANRCDVRGMLTHADGKPAAKLKLDARLQSKTGSHRSGDRLRLTTDENGAYSFPLTGEEMVKVVDYRRLVLVFHPGEGPSLSSNVEMPTQLPNGELDLGTSALQLLPLSVAGRVTNGKGEPVAGALLTLKSETTFEGSDHTYWTPVQGGQTRSGSDGKFAVHADVTDLNLQIVAKASGFTSTTIAVQEGETVEIQLEPAAFMAGIVWLDDDISANKMKVSAVVRKDGERWSRHHFSSELTPLPDQPGAYSYRLNELKMGIAELSLNGPQGQPITRVKDVQLSLGSDCTPPDWRELDLRGRLQRVELRLFNSSGEAVRSEASAYLNRGRSIHARDAKFELYLMDELPQISIVASGYRVEELQRVSQSQDVILNDGWEIQLRIPTEFANQSGYTLRAQLFPQVDSDIVATSEDDMGFILPGYAAETSAEFGADGTATLRVPAHGQFWVNLDVIIRSTDPPSIRTQSFGAGTSIVVKEQIGVQTFDLQVPEEKLNDVLEAKGEGR